MSLLGRLIRRRPPKDVVLDVRTPSLGADADLRIAVSPRFAELAEHPGAGLLSGDGPVVLPDPLDERTASRVLDAIAPTAPREFVSTDALVGAASAAFAKYSADRSAHEAWSGVSVDAVFQACAIARGSNGVSGRSDLERFAASDTPFSDWLALMEAPLYQALIWLGHRAAQQALHLER